MRRSSNTAIMRLQLRRHLQLQLVHLSGYLVFKLPRLHALRVGPMRTTSFRSSPLWRIIAFALINLNLKLLMKIKRFHGLHGTGSSRSWRRQSVHGAVLIQVRVVIPPPALLMLALRLMLLRVVIPPPATVTLASPLVRLPMGLGLQVALAPPVSLSQLRPPAGALIWLRPCLRFRTDRNIGPSYGVDYLFLPVLPVLFHVVNSAAMRRPARP